MASTVQSHAMRFQAPDRHGPTGLEHDGGGTRRNAIPSLHFVFVIHFLGPYSKLDALMVAFFESAGDGPEIKRRIICLQGLELPDKSR